jgi:hypothetical protein
VNPRHRLVRVPLHYNTEHGLTGEVTGTADKEVEEVTDMFADLAKKVRQRFFQVKRRWANNATEEEEVFQKEGGRR